MKVSALKGVLPDIAILVLVVAVYLPALRGEFIWDDDSHITENPYIVGSWGLRAIWTGGSATYYPLTETTFWIEHALWGLNPFPFHLVNLLMHALCAILLRHVLLGLGAPQAGASFGATIWAIHPMQAESVAWVTELKNTQSGAFYLAAILLFLKWNGRTSSNWRSRIQYCLIVLFGMLALLSKTSTVMLPIVLGLCAVWLDGRWMWKTAKRLIPFVLISAAAAAWTIYEQKFHSGALGAEWSQDVLSRIAVAGYSIWFYLVKLIWPQPLIFVYPRWSVDTNSVFSFLPMAAALAALAFLWPRRNGRLRPVFFAMAYFVVSLFPVLDFFDVYFFRYSFVGDHFQYLAAIGPLALAGAAVARGLDKITTPYYRLAAATVLIVVLGIQTVGHVRVFRDDETLWRDTIKKNPNAWIAYNNLAAIFMERHDYASAIAELEATLRINPRHSEAHANLGNILLESGRFDEAISHFQQALEGTPDYARMHDSLGAALLMTNRLDEGIAHLKRAVELDPLDVTAREHLGVGLGRQGDPTAALKQFEAALRVAPNSSSVHKFMGIALLALDRKEQALHHLEEAIRLDSTDGDARRRLEELRTSHPK